MKRILFILAGMALMFAQSQNPAGLKGAAATSSANLPASLAPVGTTPNAAVAAAENPGKETAGTQNVIAIGAVVANVAALGSKK